MLRRIAVLVLLLGILPAAVQALPRGSGPDAPVAVRPTQDWLLRLGSFLDGLLGWFVWAQWQPRI